jgi:hypothetical protein
MNSTQQGKPTPKRKAPNTEHSVQPHPSSEQEDEAPSAEEVRHGSQTAQDREHTIRRGDDVTTQTKEFPT